MRKERRRGGNRGEGRKASLQHPSPPLKALSHVILDNNEMRRGKREEGGRGGVPLQWHLDFLLIL
jgi:hypothetical protein